MLKPSPLSAEGEGHPIRSDPNVDRGGAGRVRDIFRLSQWCRTDAVFIAVLVVVCALSAFIGVAGPLGSFSHDIFFLLDNAYRVVQGQVPDRDFSSAWGPVIYLVDAAGLLLSGMQPAGLGYANALFGALLAIWAFFIVRTKGYSAIACVVGIYTVLLVTAPFPIGNSPFDFGYAMLYNRYGYALFGIVMMECAENTLSAQAGQGSLGAISTGMALGLLAFLKISYAIVAIPFVAVLAICAGASAGDLRRRFLGLSGGFITLAVVVMCYLRFDVTDMLRDLATAATARRLSLKPMRPVGILDLIQAAIIFIFAGSMCRAEWRASHGHASRFRWVLFALLTVAAGYLLFISNQQLSTFPLNGYAAMVLAAVAMPLTTEKFLNWPGFSPGFPRLLMVVVCFLSLCICILPLSIGNGISLAAAALEWPKPKSTDVSALASPERGAGLLFGSVRGSMKTEIMGAEYVEALNDGMALLRRHTGPRDGVLTFDEFNPFNYLLDRPSPRGGFAATAYNYVFCDTAHPTAEQFFGDSPYIMVRKYTREGQDSVERGNVLGLMRIYGTALRSHFSVVEETDHWVLWHRVAAFGDRITR